MHKSASGTQKKSTGEGPSSSRPPSRANSRTGIGKQSAFDRLSQGLSARTRSLGAPDTEGVPEPERLLSESNVSATNNTVRAHEPAPPTQSSTAQADQQKNDLEQTGEAPLRINSGELLAVQGICESENAPLRNDIRCLREEIAEAKQPSGYNLKEEIDKLKHDQLEFQQRQAGELRELKEQLPSAELLATLTREFGTLRQDHNSLMEQSSRVNRVAEHGSPAPAETAGPSREDRIRELEGQLAALRQSNAQARQAGTEAHLANGRENESHQIRDRSPSPVHDRDNRRRRAQSPDSNYSSDDDPAYYNAGYREVADDPTRRIRFYEREKGPAYLTLRAERPSDPTFDRLMNYRFYRLLKRRASRDAEAMIDGQRRMKALQRSLDSQSKFDGKDPILVFAFLTRFTEECDLNGLTEAQALVALPRFLTGDASLSFQTAQSSGQSGGVNSWPEAVHFLLTSHATPSAMREAVIRVQEMKQKATEDELAYNARLSHAIYRCGNVFSEAQKTTYFVNGLLPDIRSRVARYREGIPRHAVRYNSIVQYARDEGETVRAQHASIRQAPRRQASTTPAQAHFLDGSDRPSQADDANQQGAFLLQDAAGHSQAPTGYQPVSDNTSDLPSTLDAEGAQQGELFMVQPPKLPFSNGQTERNRPGWKSADPLICYGCFAKNDHIAPNCQADPLDFSLIVQNYESLSQREQALVPNGVGTYHLAKRCLAASQAKNPNPTGPKN